MVRQHTCASSLRRCAALHAPQALATTDSAAAAASADAARRRELESSRKLRAQLEATVASQQREIGQLSADRTVAREQLDRMRSEMEGLRKVRAAYSGRSPRESFLRMHRTPASDHQSPITQGGRS